VLSLILVACVVVGGLAGYGTIRWWYAAIPGALLVAWLVACRLMVKRERNVATPAVTPAETTSASPAATTAVRRESADGSGVDEADLIAGAETESIPRAVVDPVPSADPTLWDPVPVTLPTYVSKPPAVRRTVRFIDLESTGVWTSGRSEAESRIAREAEEDEKAERSEPGQDRAVGS
jgi:hypothetical protein